MIFRETGLAAGGLHVLASSEEPFRPFGVDFQIRDRDRIEIGDGEHIAALDAEVLCPGHFHIYTGADARAYLERARAPRPSSSAPGSSGSSPRRVRSDTVLGRG